MPDIELRDALKRRDGIDVTQVKAMTRVDTQAQSGRNPDRFAQSSNLNVGARGVKIRLGIGAGVQLDDRCANFGRGTNLGRIRIDEQGNPDPGILELPDRGLNSLPPADDVKATFGPDGDADSGTTR